MASSVGVFRSYLSRIETGKANPTLLVMDAIARVLIRVIQVLLGHQRLDTTAHYVQVATDLLREVISPLGATRNPAPRQPEQTA